MNKDGYDINKCYNCGLVFVNEKFNQKDIVDNFYSDKNNYQRHRVKLSLDKIKINKKYNFIFNFLNENKIKGKLLDVGCSNGEFLYFAQKRGIDSFGVEVNKITADFAIKNGLKVKNGFLEEQHYQDNYFSVIRLGDLIEHLVEPEKILIECKRILKNNSYLIISTPNLNCFWSKITFLLYKIFKIPWSSLTPPLHLYYFSNNNLDMLLKKYNFNPVLKKYYNPSKLKHELGRTHLLRRYKNNKSFVNFIYMLFAYSFYSIFYFINLLYSSIINKNFFMLAIYKLEK